MPHRFFGPAQFAGQFFVPHGSQQSQFFPPPKAPANRRDLQPLPLVADRDGFAADFSRNFLIGVAAQQPQFKFRPRLLPIGRQRFDSQRPPPPAHIHGRPPQLPGQNTVHLRAQQFVFGGRPRPGGLAKRRNLQVLSPVGHGNESSSQLAGHHFVRRGAQQPVLPGGPQLVVGVNHTGSEFALAFRPPLAALATEGLPIHGLAGNPQLAAAEGDTFRGATQLVSHFLIGIRPHQFLLRRRPTARLFALIRGNTQKFAPSGHRVRGAMEAFGQIAVGVFAQQPVFCGRPFPLATTDTGQPQHGNPAGLDRRKAAPGQGRHLAIRQRADQPLFGFRPAPAGRTATNAQEVAPPPHRSYGAAKLPGQLRIRQSTGG